MTSGFYPEPRQYLHTEFKNAKNNNDFWGFGTPEVDELIKIYEENLDPEMPDDAMWKIDQIVHDEAFYIPFWDAPYIRLVYWDYVQFPEFYLPRRTQHASPIGWSIGSIRTRRRRWRRPSAPTRRYPLDQTIDKDFYNVKQKFQ